MVDKIACRSQVCVFGGALYRQGGLHTARDLRYGGPYHYSDMGLGGWDILHLHHTGVM